MNLEKLRLLLEKALSDRSRRVEHVERFQAIVWDAEKLDHRPGVEETLRELAYDLDYYQPNERARAEDSSLYGDDRLEDKIRSALSRLPDR